MTPTALTNLIPSVGKSSSPVSSTTAAPGATSADADQFSAQLATSIASATALKSAATSTASATAAPASGDTASPLTALQTQIAAALNAGQSVSSVVTQLANSLAAKVAAKLGVSTDDARKRLEAAFTSALSPPGTSTGPPLSAAQQALALAQTFLQIAGVATGVATGESGQLNRLVGTDLDADQAKVTPAQTTDTPLATAQNAQAVAASAAAGADTAALARLAAPGASVSSDSPQGDGRSVVLAENVAAQSTGGNTLLGRILARAALAAPATPAASATAAASADASVSSAAQAVVDALLGETSAGQSFGSAIPNATAAPAAAASPTAATVTPGVTAFLQAFTAALSSSASATTAAATLDPRDRSASSDAGLLVAGSSTSETAAAFVPSVPGFSIDQASTPGSTTAPGTAAQTTADPSAIVEQVLRGAFLQTNGTSSTIRLSLVPEHLGDVSVKLSVDATGNVSAHVTAQTAEAGHALTQGQSQLTRSLAEAGLKLTGFTVDVSNSGLGGNASGQQQSSQQSSTGRRTLIAGLDADAPSGDESALLAVPTFGPPIVANRTLGAYNYLA